MQCLRTDKEILKLVGDDKQFSNENNSQETEFKVKIQRQRTVMPGKLAVDEICSFSDEFHYKTHVYTFFLNAIIISISAWFHKPWEILKNLLSSMNITSVISKHFQMTHSKKLKIVYHKLI